MAVGLYFHGGLMTSIAFLSTFDTEVLCHGSRWCTRLSVIYHISCMGWYILPLLRITAIMLEHIALIGLR